MASIHSCSTCTACCMHITNSPTKIFCVLKNVIMNQVESKKHIDFLVAEPKPNYKEETSTNQFHELQWSHLPSFQDLTTTTTTTTAITQPLIPANSIFTAACGEFCVNISGACSTNVHTKFT